MKKHLLVLLMILGIVGKVQANGYAYLMDSPINSRSNALLTLGCGAIVGGIGFFIKNRGAEYNRLASGILVITGGVLCIIGYVFKKGEIEGDNQI